MAATAISNLLADIDVHQFLKIYQMNGFTRNLSENSDMWNKLQSLSEMDATARSVKYLLIDQLGYAAVQALPADGSGTYPAASRSGLQQPEALYKEWGWTVDVPRVLEGKTGSELMQYAKPLATELDNKQIAFARLKCVELQGDGSGSIGKLTADPTVSTANDSITFTVSHATADAGRSFARWFQEGDHIYFCAEGGAATAANIHDSAGGTSITADTEVSYWKITDVNESSAQVTAQPYSSSNTLITVANATVNDEDPSSGDYCYRGRTVSGAVTQGTVAPDLSSIAIDYAKLSVNMAGLETILANDGRTIHGITMSGAIKGTRKDLSAATLDSKHFQQLLSELKRKVGKGRYKYSDAFMADETYDSLVESRETDRRFHSIEDSDRGVKGIGYVHGKDRVEFVPDEFVHTQRIWVLPDGKDAFCYLGKDAKQVAPNGNDPMRLSSSSAGYGRSMETNFEQAGVLISKHPRAGGVIEDFTVSS